MGERGSFEVQQVPEQTAEAVEEALVQDRRSTGRLRSRSAWVREAANVAAAVAERAHGGQLPAPPARLAPGPGRDR